MFRPLTLWRSLHQSPCHQALPVPPIPHADLELFRQHLFHEAFSTKPSLLVAAMAACSRGGASRCRAARRALPPRSWRSPCDRDLGCAFWMKSIKKEPELTVREWVGINIRSRGRSKGTGGLLPVVFARCGSSLIYFMDSEQGQLRERKICVPIFTRAPHQAGMHSLQNQTMNPHFFFPCFTTPSTCGAGR